MGLSNCYRVVTLITPLAKSYSYSHSKFTVSAFKLPSCILAILGGCEQPELSCDSGRKINLGKDEALPLEINTSTECQESLLYGSISDAITRLFEITKLVGKSTTRDRHAKADVAKDNPIHEFYDIAHVHYKFCNGKTCPLLLERLGKANAKRREYFWYCRTHRNRLAVEAKYVQTREDKLWHARKETACFSHLASLPRTAARTEGTKPSMVETSASTLGPVNLKNVDDVFDEIRSNSTMANSVFGNKENDLLSIPKLVDVASPGTDFECPLFASCRGFGSFTWTFCGWEEKLRNLSRNAAIRRNSLYPLSLVSS